MTRDDIIRMARKCEDVPLDDSTTNIWVFFTEQLEHFAALVSAAEREACAEVATNWRCNGMPRRALGDAIRARGESE